MEPVFKDMPRGRSVKRGFRPSHAPVQTMLVPSHAECAATNKDVIIFVSIPDRSAFRLQQIL